MAQGTWLMSQGSWLMANRKITENANNELIKQLKRTSNEMPMLVDLPRFVTINVRLLLFPRIPTWTQSGH